MMALWHVCAVLAPGAPYFQHIISLDGDCQFQRSKALSTSQTSCDHAPLWLIALLTTSLGKKRPHSSHPETALTAPPGSCLCPIRARKRCQAMGNDIDEHLGSCCEIQGPETPDIVAAMAKAAQISLDRSRRAQTEVHSSRVVHEMLTALLHRRQTDVGQRKWPEIPRNRLLRVARSREPAPIYYVRR